MKGVEVKKIGGTFDYVEDLEKPTPGKNQILVKSVVTAINPVEAYMQGTGALVLSWPIVLGCDASGVVVKVGEGVTKFKVGDKVFGCTRLGHPGYCTFQEFFLMDDHLTFNNSGYLSMEQAATVGVGLLTACLGLISGTKIELTSKKCDESSEWVIIFGSSGSVGSFAVQVAKLCGYKVLAACSPSNVKFVESVGADATFNHRLSLDEQLKEINKIAGGKFSRIFDASTLATETAMASLAQHGDPKAKPKYFATTNDWSPIEPVKGIETCKVELGVIGRTDSEQGQEVSSDIAGFIPKLEEFLESGQLKPMEFDVAASVGPKEILKALDVFNNKAGGSRKIVVRVAEE